MNRVIRRLRPSFRRAARAERGGVAIMFSLSLMPLALMTLGAVDCSRAVMTKTSFQDALDAAALAVARNNVIDQTKMDELGLKVLKANLDPSLVAGITSSSFKRVANRIEASAKLNMSDTLIMPAMEIGAASDAVAAGDRLEVALVLDNTYSMILNSSNQVVADPNATKLHQLKIAAKAFIDQLEAASKNVEAGAVKISLVPFSNTVRVGAGYQAASWIDPAGGPTGSNTNDLWGAAAPPNRFTLLSQMNQTWAGCVEARSGGYDVLETAPAAGATLYTPYFAPDELDGSTTARNNYRADGSTSSDYKVKQRHLPKYTGTPGNVGTTFVTNSEFANLSLGYRYGPNFGCRLEPLTRLTTEYAALRTSIDNMIPVGETIIPMGLAWGWNTLSPEFPWPEDATHFKGTAYGHVHAATGAPVRKIVVLMTDGENVMLGASSSTNPNRSLYSGAQYGWNGLIGTNSTDAATRTTAINAKLATLCTNMKAKGVLIYTIRVEVTAGSNATLTNCASQPDMAYDVQKASQMQAVFVGIAGRITRLRLAS